MCQVGPSRDRPWLFLSSWFETDYDNPITKPTRTLMGIEKGTRGVVKRSNSTESAYRSSIPADKHTFPSENQVDAARTGPLGLQGKSDAANGSCLRSHKTILAQPAGKSPNIDGFLQSRGEGCGILERH
jgi:hypothetical protein